VLKFVGSNNNLVTLVLKSPRYPCSVITLVPLISLKIQCIILELSILKLGIISLESKLVMVFVKLNSLSLKNN